MLSTTQSFKPHWDFFVCVLITGFEFNNAIFNSNSFTNTHVKTPTKPHVKFAYLHL